MVCLCLIGWCTTSCARSPVNKRGLHACEVGKEKALCGAFEVFENRQTRTGRRIALKITVFPARTAHPQPDPVFFLPGGPGAGAGGAEQAQIFASYMRERDLVLVDPRGTGDSDALNCPI